MRREEWHSARPVHIRDLSAGDLFGHGFREIRVDSLTVVTVQRDRLRRAVDGRNPNVPLSVAVRVDHEIASRHVV
jgi:hypothetical protein